MTAVRLTRSTASVSRAQAHFRLSPVAAVLASLGVLTTMQAAWAQTAAAPSLSELQQENARLGEENARLTQALEQSQKAGAAAATPADRALDNAATPAASSSTTSPTSADPATTDYQGDPLLLQAVTVTGSKIKEQPKSVSLVTGEELEKFHVYNFRDIVNRIGNVRTSWQNPNTTSIFLRGLGWAAGAGPMDPSVGLSIDGVSYGINAVAALANFSDIETASVTRGPAGVDGGKASSVGRITIKTREPGFIPEARGSLTFGQLNTVIGTAVIGGAAIDDVLAFRLSFHRETADGAYLNKNDTTFTWRNTDRTSARAQFLLTPGKGFKAALTLDYIPTGKEQCENCFTFNRKTPAFYDSVDQNGNRIAVNYDNDPFGKLNRRWFLQKADWSVNGDFYADRINRFDDYPNTYATKGAALNLDWLLGDSKISSISAWKDYHFTQGAGSHTVFDWLKAPRGVITDYYQVSQEFKLDSTISDTLRYQGGIYLFGSRFPQSGDVERYGADAGAYYSNKAQYDLLDKDAAGRQLLLNSADQLTTLLSNKLENKTAAIYSNLNWDLSKALLVSGGLRVSSERRSSSGAYEIASQGFSPDLNPVSVNNVQLGGFNNDPSKNNPAQTALADSVAQKYFSVSTYAALTADQRNQIAAAKAIRAARIGGVYGWTDAEPYKATLPTVDLSSLYRVDTDHSLFASWKHGEKAGISQIVGGTVLGGKSVPARTEKSNSFEIGSKSRFLNRALTLNATLYLQNITDYIQPIYFYDDVQTKLNNNGLLAYTAGLGNVPKVQAKGLELDGAYSGIKYTTITFSVAYNDARYKDFKFLANPGELGANSTPYYDATGKTLPGAPKFSGNVFADFSYPIAGSKLVRTSVNYNYQTHYNNDPSLSRYTETGGYGTTDVSLGLGRQDGKFEVSLVAKNLFDHDTGFLTAWNQYKPRVPRWFGITFNASQY